MAPVSVSGTKAARARTGLGSVHVGRGRLLTPRFAPSSRLERIEAAHQTTRLDHACGLDRQHGWNRRVTQAKVEMSYARKPQHEALVDARPDAAGPTAILTVPPQAESSYLPSHLA